MVCFPPLFCIFEVSNNEFKFCSQWRHDYKLFSNNTTTIKNIKEFKKNNAQLEAYNTTAVD